MDENLNQAINEKNESNKTKSQSCLRLLKCDYFLM